MCFAKVSNFELPNMSAKNIPWYKSVFYEEHILMIHSKGHEIFKGRMAFLNLGTILVTSQEVLLQNLTGINTMVFCAHWYGTVFNSQRSPQNVSINTHNVVYR